MSHYPAHTFRKTLCARPGHRHWTTEAQMLMLPGFAPRLEKAHIKWSHLFMSSNSSEGENS